MNTRWLNFWFACFVSLYLDLCCAQGADDKLRVLIIDGHNNHDWRITTDDVKATLEATDRFKVSVSSAPQSKIHFAPRKPKNASAAELKRFERIELEYQAAKERALVQEQNEWEQWNPQFSDFHAVLLNYNGPSWPKRVQSSLVDYVANGGGLILVHAPYNAFRDWDAFNKLIGFGYSGHRGLPEGHSPSCIKINDARAMPTDASLGYENENRIAQAANYIRYAWGHELPPHRSRPRQETAKGDRRKASSMDLGRIGYT
jgi:hypothetical protein